MISKKFSLAFYMSWCQLAVLFGFVIHRILLSSHPLFSWAMEKHFLLHGGVGLASDLFFACATVAVLELVKMAQRPLAQTLGVLGSFGATIYLLLFLAGNLRLVQHFGIQTRWEHFQFVGTFADVKGGSVFLFLSKGTWWITLLSTCLGYLAARGLQSSRLSPVLRGNPQLRFVAWIVLAVIFESGHLQLRKHFGAYPELENNVFANIYDSYKKDRNIRHGYDSPSEDEVKRYRSHFSSGRQWEDGKITTAPLSQRSIASPGIPPGLKDPLIPVRAFLAKKAKEKGPWNVVIVIQESLRADRLSYFGKVSERFQDLTPHFSRTLPEALIFQETIATGTTTPEGQSAILCSLYSLPVIQMIDKPQLSTLCLGDYFAGKGYETLFLTGQNGAIHNQRIFHEAHKVKTVVEQKDFDRAVPEGAWGVNDHSLFQKTLATLKEVRQPFFATVLTISYHGPYTLPSDSPFSISPTLDEEQKVLSYVDAAWGVFYDQLKENLPHTIVIMVSDHGIINEEDKFTKRPFDYENIRQVYRIPFAIFIPDLPAYLKGLRFSQLASNADVPPTLLSLLDDRNVPNNFMGMDAFSRDEWVGMRWLGELYRLYPGASPRLESLPDSELQFLAYLVRNNLAK